MAFVDVFVPQHVRISKDPPPEGQVGKAYSYVITAKVENDANDSDYDYHFTLADETIPPGTQFAERRENGHEYAEVAGVPTQTGRFFFAVSVKSDIQADWFGDDDTDEAVYSVTIR
jgi:hypothetical protein